MSSFFESPPPPPPGGRGSSVRPVRGQTVGMGPTWGPKTKRMLTVDRQRGSIEDAGG